MSFNACPISRQKLLHCRAAAGVIDAKKNGWKSTGSSDQSAISPSQISFIPGGGGSPPQGFQNIFKGNYAENFFVWKVNALHVPCARGDFACLVRRHYPIKNILFTFNENPENLFPSFYLEENFRIAVFFVFLNGYIISVNLNKVWITKQSPSWKKFGGSHETVQQNTSVTMPAAGGKNF